MTLQERRFSIKLSAHDRLVLDALEAQLRISRGEVMRRALLMLADHGGEDRPTQREVAAA